MDIDGLCIGGVRLDRRRQGTAPAVVVGTGADTYADTAACSAAGTVAGTFAIADAAADIVALAAATFGTHHDSLAVCADLAIQMRAPLRQPPKGPGEP